MTADESGRIIEHVDRHFDEECQFLAALVRTPSDNPPGDCVPHARRAASLLRAMGFEVEEHPVPADLAAAHGMIGVTNLIVRRAFGSGPVLALNAHGDVVPPGAGWSADPYGAEVRDGAMYGRGVAVSKSDFATYAFALQAVAASGASLARDGRAASYLRRGGGRFPRAPLAPRERIEPARLRDRRRIFL